MKNVDVIDFRGGYNTQDPSELMDPGELLTAENCYWSDDGLVQRKGHRPYATSTYAASDVIRGVSERVFLNSAWHNIVALDVDLQSEVRFYYQTTTGMTLLSASVVFTTGQEVFFAALQDHVVAVNGTDMPLVIYYDSGWQIETLETHDIRTWNTTLWNAGQYVAAESTYTDDASDAKDSTAADFELGNTTAGDGFWIACSHPFTKIVLDTAEQAGGSPVAVYEYYNGSSWQPLTLTTTPVWTDAEADRIMEWDYQILMERYGDGPLGLTNYYVIRVRFTTAASAAFSCTRAYVYHTHYISEMTENTAPDNVFAHGSRLWLAAGYTIYYSPPNDVVDWRGMSESEYFLEGGPTIRGGLSFNEFLMIFKDNATYAFYGNGIDSFMRKKISDRGVVSPHGFVGTEVGVFYMSSMGLRVQTGQVEVAVSKHIQTDIDAWTLSDVVMVYWKGKVFISFPTDGEGLYFDPATLSIDEDTGDGRVAFYKFKSWQVNYFIDCSGKGDLGTLLASVAGAQPYVARLENGGTDQNRATAAAGIAYKIVTSYLALGAFAIQKIYGRLVSKLHKAATATIYTLTVRADKADRSTSATITAPAGTGDYVHRGKLPYTLGGYNISLEITNSSETDCGITGFSLEYEKKRL